MIYYPQTGTRAFSQESSNVFMYDNCNVIISLYASYENDARMMMSYEHIYIYILLSHRYNGDCIFLKIYLMAELTMDV